MMPAQEPTYCHVCPDGHTWLEQPDGGVSPSYGYGGTSHTWPGYDPRTCPEPARVDGHGYECRSCKRHSYGGSCGCKRWKPPRPICRKSPRATFIWVDGTPASRRRGEPTGWVDVTERQLAFDSIPWSQPADAIDELRRLRRLRPDVPEAEESVGLLDTRDGDDALDAVEGVADLESLVEVAHDAAALVSLGIGVVDQVPRPQSVVLPPRLLASHSAGGYR